MAPFQIKLFQYVIPMYKYQSKRTFVEWSLNVQDCRGVMK